MAAIARLNKELVPLIVSEFFSKCRLAEERRGMETNAVIVIQAHVRGFLIRRRLQHLRHVAVTIQRYWRGYLGRLRAKAALEERNRALRQAYFDSKATIIQKWWRAFYSRKNIHDFYARKLYLAAVRERNEQIRSELAEEAERAIMLQRQEAEERARSLFERKVGKLHHLVSTANQPGIFNSPYSLATGTLPVIMGLPVEDHLKTSMKAQLSQKLPPLSKAKAAKGQPAYPSTVNVELMGRTVPARYTLRQTAEYDAAHQAQVLEEKIHRGEMLTRHPVAFTPAVGKPKPPVFDVQTNRNLERFRDPADPLLGGKAEYFPAQAQKMSQTAFSSYIKKQPFFDHNITEAY